MLDLLLIACIFWLLLLPQTAAFPRGKSFNDSYHLNDGHSSANGSIDAICPPESLFCHRCNQKLGIRDAKTCVVTELKQKAPDGLLHHVDGGSATTGDGTRLEWEGGDYAASTAALVFVNNGTDISLQINIDSCRRIDWDTLIGPINVRNKKIDVASMGAMVTELHSLPNKDAVAFVLDNAFQAEKEIKAFLNSAFPSQTFGELTFADEVEQDFKNITIQHLSNIICKAPLGILAWTAMLTAVEHVTLPDPSLVSQDTRKRVVALSAFLLTTHSIEYLEGLTGSPVGLQLCQWGLWIILATVSRLRALVNDLNPFERMQQLREIFKRALMRLAWEGRVIVNWTLGLVDAQTAEASAPEECRLPPAN